MKVLFCNKTSFSAYWLRSSVVSVLISLISDMTTHVVVYDVKLFFEGVLRCTSSSPED